MLGACEMDLESFAVTHSQMSDELLVLVADASANKVITKDRLADFCQKLTDYLTYDALTLTPPPCAELMSQAEAFSKIYGKGVDPAKIYEFKDKLGKIYELLVIRLTDEKSCLPATHENSLPLQDSRKHGR